MISKKNYNDFDLHILLYANKYSKDLIIDFTKNKEINTFSLINIGKSPQKHSIYCQPNHYSYLSQFINCYNFYKYIQEELTQQKRIYIIIPCTNHLLAGMLIKLSQKHRSLMQIDNVSEGTLNYCNRALSSREVINRIVKKLVSIIMLFPYKFSLGDNLKVVTDDSMLICRNKKNIVTNSKNIIELKRHNLKTDEPNNNKILIIGTHIIESDNISKSHLYNLSNSLLKFPINFEAHDIYYLPHPRSNNCGALEKKYAYANLNLEHINSNLTAEEIVLKISPKIILALCGSTLFLELEDYDHNFILISWGFDELIKANSKQAKALYEIQKDLKTLPENNFEKF